MESPFREILSRYVTTTDGFLQWIKTSTGYPIPALQIFVITENPGTLLQSENYYAKVPQDDDLLNCVRRYGRFWVRLDPYLMSNGDVIQLGRHLRLPEETMRSLINVGADGSMLKAMASLELDDLQWPKNKRPDFV